MATPAQGTIPALPQYGTGGLTLATTVAIEIVDTAVATSAASYRMSQIDFVGKAPGVMTPGTPTANDMIAFLQASSNLPYFTYVGSIGAALGNLPVGGTTGQFLTKTSATNYASAWTSLLSVTPTGGTTAYVLTKNSATDYDYSWSPSTSANGLPSGGSTGQLLQKLSGSDYSATWAGIGALVAAGTSLGTTGSATSIVFGVSARGIGTAQMGTASVDLTTNTVTGILPMANGGLGTNSIATNAIVVSQGANNAVSRIAAATSGFVLAGQGTGTLPAFVNITTLAVTQVTAGGGLTFTAGTTNGSVTGTGTIQAVRYPFVKTALYTAVTGDLGSLIAFSTAALATFVVPQANATSFGAGWFVDVINFGGTTVVLAPGTSNLTGVGATSFIGPNQSVRLVSDATNYMAWEHQGLQLSRVNTAQTFSGGMRLVSYNAGTTSGGTSITFDSGNGPIQHVRNAGTGTFTAPSNDGEIDVLVMATTNASTITFSGFNASASAPTGDTVTWNATAIFLLSMRRVNGSSTYRWAAYQ